MAEEKKRKSLKDAEAKKAARREAARKKRKGSGGDADGSSEEPDGAKPKKSRKSTSKAARTRGREQFQETDPPILRRGASLPAQYRLGSFSSFKDFMAEVCDGKPALLRCKKGAVKKN